MSKNQLTTANANKKSNIPTTVDKTKTKSPSKQIKPTTDVNT